MFIKVFSQILDSTIADDWQVRHVFEDLLKLAEYKTGVIDMTPKAISRRTGIPLEIVLRAIDNLSQPDPGSRSIDEEGRRIVLLDKHRTWGWKIVNYEHYRNIRDEDDRRAYFRDRKRIQRTRTSDCLGQIGQSKTVKEGQGQSNDVTYTDTDTDTDKKHTKPSVASLLECERIYDAYPKKVAKQAALKAIRKACTQIPPDELLRRVKAFAHQMLAEGKDPQYIPYPATWFSRGSYDDDFTPHPNGEINASGNRNQARTNGNRAAAAAAIAAIYDSPADGSRGGATGFGEPGNVSDLRVEIG